LIEELRKLTVEFNGDISCGVAEIFAIISFSSWSIVIVWLTNIEFPQSSITSYVLVTTVGQLPSLTSFNQTTDGVPQLSSSSIIKLISGSGRGPVGKDMSGGADAVGGVMSLIVII